MNRSSYQRAIKGSPFKKKIVPYPALPKVLDNDGPNLVESVLHLDI
jgi:hypothetical protein